MSQRAVLSVVQASHQPYELVYPWSLDAHTALLGGLIYSSQLSLGCADSTVLCRDGKYPLT